MTQECEGYFLWQNVYFFTNGKFIGVNEHRNDGITIWCHKQHQTINNANQHLIMHPGTPSTHMD